MLRKKNADNDLKRKKMKITFLRLLINEKSKNQPNYQQVEI